MVVGGKQDSRDLQHEILSTLFFGEDPVMRGERK
jgi:hypothetical protein